MIAEAATIENIEISNKYKYVRTFRFVDKKYTVVAASNVLYDIGETVLFIPEGTKLPVWALKQCGLWDYTNNNGLLFGKNKNIVRPYYYNNDKDYFSYGIILKPEDGFLYTGNTRLSISDPKLSSYLDFSYIKKGLPYFFDGDKFYYDVRIDLPTQKDLLCCYTQFNNNYVFIKQQPAGRLFYITIERYKSDFRAFGNSHNVFITSPELDKYSFFSRTKKNINGNLFVKTAIAGSLIERLEGLLRNNSTINKFTFELVLKSIAFGAKKDRDNPSKELLTLCNVYIGDQPMGRFLNNEELEKIGKDYGIKTIQTIDECYFDFDYIEGIINNNNSQQSFSLSIRTEDNKQQAVLPTKLYRIRRVFSEH